MATKREQILAQIKTNLNGTTGVGDRIYRSRVEALTRSETPAIIIEPISDTPQDTQSFNDKIKYDSRYTALEHHLSRNIFIQIICK